MRGGGVSRVKWIVAGAVLFVLALLKLKWRRRPVGALQRAIEHGNEDSVRLLLSKGADVNACSPDRPLVVAIRHDRRAIFDLLRVHHARCALHEIVPLLRCDGDRKSMLTVVIRQEHNMPMPPSSEGKVDCSILMGEDPAGPLEMHPLYAAVMLSDIELVVELLGGQPIPEEMRPRLVRLCSTLPMARFLQSQGCDVSRPVADGSNALFKACDPDLVTWLIEQGCNVNATIDVGDNEALRQGTTPLYYAAQAGYYEVVDILLEHGANPNLVAALWETTPLSQALENGHVATAERLMHAGARPGRLTSRQAVLYEELCTQMRRVQARI